MSHSFRMKIHNNLSILDQMIEYGQLNADYFGKFYFEQLSKSYKEVVDGYEQEMNHLYAKIVQLEKELIFTQLPPEQCR